jgi:hypothetical protein
MKDFRTFYRVKGEYPEGRGTPSIIAENQFRVIAYICLGIYVWEFMKSPLVRTNSSMAGSGDRTAITKEQSLDDLTKAVIEKKSTKSKEQEPEVITPGKKDDSVVLEKLAAMEANFTQKINALETSSSEKDARIDILAAENRQLRQVNELQGVSNFVDGLVANQQCKPCDRQSKIQGILSMPNNVTVDYGDEGSIRSMTPRAWYMEELTNSPKLWGGPTLPGAETTPDEEKDESTLSFGSSVDLDSIKLDRKIRAYAKENGVDANKNYAEAVDLYTRDHSGVKI